ncbi:MAG: glycosyltransferase family 4 protein [Clostridia bacterium]|nr:glycosyltransferase family 4 protein [Clostridia bacterium]
MKVLIVNKFLYPNGGSETYIFELGKQLEKMGHEVQFFGMQDDRNIVGNHVNAYTKNMQFHGNKISKLVYPIKIIYSAEARKKIRNVLEDFKPDVVHLNNFNFQLTPSIIYEVKKHRIPIVFTAHDYQLVCPNHMCLDVLSRKVCQDCIDHGYAQCMKKKCIHGSKLKSILGTVEAVLYQKLHTYRYIDAVICPSEFMEEKLDTNPDLMGKTITMHNFISVSGESEQAFEKKQKDPYVVYFGRYEYEKGVHTLLEVCKALPEVSFRFAGRGPLKEQIDQLPNAKDCGFIKTEQVKELVSNALFAVCPSEWYENCPFSIMEAMTYGTPVIGSRIGGIPELIREHQDGLLYESGNAKELKEKISLLWNDRSMCQSYSEQCRYVQYDTVETYVEKLIEIYQLNRK